jgi:hypothetical protein
MAAPPLARRNTADPHPNQLTLLRRWAAEYWPSRLRLKMFPSLSTGGASLMTGNTTQVVLDKVDPGARRRSRPGAGGASPVPPHADGDRLVRRGCAVAAAPYAWVGFWCLAVPAAVGATNAHRDHCPRRPIRFFANRLHSSRALRAWGVFLHYLYMAQLFTVTGRICQTAAWPSNCRPFQAFRPSSVLFCRREPNVRTHDAKAQDCAMTDAITWL